MNVWARAAAVLMALLVGGCAAFKATPQESTAPAAATGSTPARAGALGVQIDIVAPADLKALLEKHLDLVRLGKMDRTDVDDTEWSRLIDAAPGQVRALLQTEGYFAPRVGLSRAPQRQAGQPDLVILSIEPGERARVSRLTLQAEGELERAASAGNAQASDLLAQWQNAFGLQAGQDFRNPRWSDAKAAALARLRASGYATANWVGTAADVDIQSNSVRLFLVVDSGPLFRYGSLDVEGLVAQDLQTVSNLLGIARGTPITETLMLDFQDRLSRSGLFENATVTLDPDPQRAGQARLVARLKEAPLQIYTFGLGVSANTGPRASVEHLYRRVFGYAASSRVKIEVGGERQAGEAEVSTHSLPGMHRYLLGGSVERLLSDTDTVLSQRLRLGRVQDKQSVERLHFLEAERSQRETDTGQRTTAVALSANFHGSWRDLDSITLPTRGLALSLQVGAGRSHSSTASDGNFTRLYGRLTGYLPLGRAWYGQARVELGQVFVGKDVIIPESQKWRAGGDESVRGYGYRSLGPLSDGVVGSGTALFTGSVELARPILDRMPSLWGALFVDAGNSANSFGNLQPALGLGVGVRWRSPVGPLRLDYAWGRETRKTRLHFSVGIAF
jgi:translocation and assembly module TamA